MFRKCPEHGWLATSEYTVADDGEPVCPICHTHKDNCGRDGSALHDHTYNAPNGTLKQAKVSPRDKFTRALKELGLKSGDSDDSTKATTSDKSCSDIGPLFGE